MKTFKSLQQDLKINSKTLWERMEAKIGVMWHDKLMETVFPKLVPDHKISPK